MSEERPPLPIGPDPDQTFAPFTVEPAANPTFACRLDVPASWREKALDAIDRPVGAEVLTPLGAWEGPVPAGDDLPPIFHVQASLLTREITAKNIALTLAIERRARGRHLVELSPGLFDASFDEVIGGQRFVSRTAVGIDGDRAFVLTGLARPALYETLSLTFGAMVASFRVLTPTTARTIERREELSLLGGAFRCQHPASFRPRLLDGSDETRAAVSLFGFDPENHISGIIHLMASPSAGRSAGERFERLLELSRAQGLVSEGEPEELPLDAEGSGLTVVGARRYRALIDGNDIPQELTATLFERDRFDLDVWMTSPAKRGSFWHWAVNRRALEIVLGTLR